MKLKGIFVKASPGDGATRIIRDEMLFLLEHNERWFEKNLRAHLLKEGCNYPLPLAKPLFYESMISGLFARADSALQKKFDAAMPFVHKLPFQQQPDSLQEDECIVHAEFYIAMRFFETHLKNSGKKMALEVTHCIERIMKVWQLEKNLFQKELDQFESYLQAIVFRLWDASKTKGSEHVPSERVRQRLYITLTTSLLSKMKVRNAFEAEFNSIPEVIHAMQQDHAVFCRFMEFCQERTPYFIFITSQTFWRTLETLRLER